MVIFGKGAFKTCFISMKLKYWFWFPFIHCTFNIVGQCAKSWLYMNEALDTYLLHKCRKDRVPALKVLIVS